MTEELIHLIVRQTEDGLYATSPQLPGFMFGCATISSLRAGLQEALAFHANTPGPFRVLEHHERHYDIADGEIVTRLANDELGNERQIVYERLGRAIQDPEQAKSISRGISNPVGEVVYVCAVPSDTLGWLTAQLSDPEDAFYAAVSIGEHMLMTLPFAHGERYSKYPDTYRSGARGYNAETRLSEIIRATPIVTPPRNNVEADV
ncbi:hypothetical protein ACI2L4_27670 [Streptomyces sparsogenes]|uniref:hypothetical protein n=1 Tax=Streptomyces sparsogenes TaxID=67365 RepID=UPI00384B335B